MLGCGTHRLASVLEREAHKLALKLKREAIQACVWMLKCDPKVYVLKNRMTIVFGTERNPRIMLLMKYDVHL